MKTVLSVLTRRWMLAILVAIFALPVAFSPFGAQVAAAQACIVRTDWPVYVVVRGDTLYKIAQRYGTTSGVLASANCLVNINTIYAGQQLRVPPSPIVLTPVPQQPPPNSTSFNVRIQYQRFDNGFMFWRSDNGEISVYIGQASGTTVSYPSYTYGLLPDNPVNEATPANHYRPAFGIGKVWGNYFNVRSNLGWAITSEVSFVTTVTRSGSYFNFNIPDGRIVYVNPNRTWSTTGNPVPPPTAVPPTPVGPTTTTTSAAYQTFDGGFMIWEGRTGNVVVFYNNGSALNATYTVYPSSQYGNLPDPAGTLIPPAGHLRPINGFGKVWINFAEPYNNLGWALTPEQGFTATFISHTSSVQSDTCFILPDGRPIDYVRLNNGVRYWMFTTTCQ